MAVKAVNDLAGPDGIVPTLLVFGAYPRLTEMDPLSLSKELANELLLQLRRLFQSLKSSYIYKILRRHIVSQLLC